MNKLPVFVVYDCDQDDEKRMAGVSSSPDRADAMIEVLAEERGNPRCYYSSNEFVVVSARAPLPRWNGQRRQKG